VTIEIEQTEWDKVTGDWRQLHTEELHDLHCSSSIILGMKWAGHVAHMETKQNAYRILVRRTEHTTWNTQT
jgi:hypothetical protein